ncbi:HAD family hydrolase [Acrocarpospora sp. B8E8]|uniref:HAD family hydrolase n=1 Tax=Acrocarpospora sp. B8E8 TaxID=3153572 RepID=UPI00325C8289
MDFGGIVADITRLPTASWAPLLAAELHPMLARVGVQMPLIDIAADILAGAGGEKAWKHTANLQDDPAELSPRELWRMTSVHWPDAARALVEAEAIPLCTRIDSLRFQRTLRPGISEFLLYCQENGLPVAVVSNVIDGMAHRTFLDHHGLAPLVAAQLYSGELGIRKPNPEMGRLACRALNRAPRQVWYVGDRYDTDVVFGKRAEFAATILMRSGSTEDANKVRRTQGDPAATVEDPNGLLKLLEQVR